MMTHTDTDLPIHSLVQSLSPGSNPTMGYNNFRSYSRSGLARFSLGWWCYLNREIVPTTTHTDTDLLIYQTCHRFESLPPWAITTAGPTPGPDSPRSTCSWSTCCPWLRGILRATCTGPGCRANRPRWWSGYTRRRLCRAWEIPWIWRGRSCGSGWPARSDEISVSKCVQS